MNGPVNGCGSPTISTATVMEIRKTSRVIHTVLAKGRSFFHNPGNGGAASRRG
jgi:hypothetical protein